MHGEHFDIKFDNIGPILRLARRVMYQLFLEKLKKLKILKLFRTLGKQLKCIAMSFPESLEA